MKRFRLVLPPARALRRVILAAASLGFTVAAPAPLSAAPQTGQAAPPVAAAIGDNAARARELYRRGRDELAKPGHIQQAYVLLAEAWGLQKSFDIAGNLALAESQLSRHRDAAEHAAFALANFPAGGTDAQRNALQELLAAARANVGCVTVRVSVDRAAITVDGKPAGESPLPYELFVDPGAHVIVALAPGCDPVRDTVRTDKGTTHLITLTPSRCGPAPPPLPPGVTPAPEGLRPLTIAGIAVTGAGLVLGATFAGLSKANADSANATAQSIQGTPGGNARACAGASPPSGCATLGDQRSSEATFANAALGAFIAAGVVGAGTLAYTLAAPRTPAAPAAGKPSPTSRLQVIPLAGPTAGGLMLKGAF